MNVGDVIKNLRDHHGLTQAHLAARLGCTEKTIRNWEHGTTNLIASRAKNIADEFGYQSWEDLLTAHGPGPKPPNGHGNAIPVLTTIPASFDADGEVQDAYDFEEAIDYLPGTFRDCEDPKMFGLVVEGDSMAPEYPDGSYVVCSPKHWEDHGYTAGEPYVLRFKNGDSTFKFIHILEDGVRLELVPMNPNYPTKRIKENEVAHASLVRGGYKKRRLPG